jgi:hypothetical protein
VLWYHFLFVLPFINRWRCFKCCWIQIAIENSGLGHGFIYLRNLMPPIWNEISSWIKEINIMLLAMFSFRCDFILFVSHMKECSQFSTLCNAYCHHQNHKRPTPAISPITGDETKTRSVFVWSHYRTSALKTVLNYRWNTI